MAQHRLRAGLTKNELAAMCGISRTTLYRIESGKFDPTQQQIAAIERVLRVASMSTADEEMLHNIAV